MHSNRPQGLQPIGGAPRGRDGRRRRGQGSGEQQHRGEEPQQGPRTVVRHGPSLRWAPRMGEGLAIAAGRRDGVKRSRHLAQEHCPGRRTAQAQIQPPHSPTPGDVAGIALRQLAEDRSTADSWERRGGGEGGGRGGGEVRGESQSKRMEGRPRVQKHCQEKLRHCAVRVHRAQLPLCEIPSLSGCAFSGHPDGYPWNTPECACRRISGHNRTFLLPAIAP